MAELKLNVETIDALTGPLIGRAKSATLRTMDVVGLDTFAAVARNTYERAPQDPYRDWFLGPKWIEELIETPVTLLSTSPERDDTILMQDPFLAS